MTGAKETAITKTYDWLEAAGRTLMVGLPGASLDPTTAAHLARVRPAGVILFGRNLDTPEQTIELLDALRSLENPPLLFAIDQEGGAVSRLAPWIGDTPAAAALACHGESAARRFGRATGRMLHALGFNLDFAPVVDLCEADACNGIGDRSFGTDPEQAAHLAGAVLDGLTEAGVAGCIKHFPGLGPTHVDSHQELPLASRSRAEMERIDLVPYRRLMALAPAVMVGHGHYPDLDPTPGRPASLSAEIVTGLLRRDLAYRGLVVTDDLEMGAVSGLDRDGSAAADAIAAGCDLALYCKDLELAEASTRTIAERAADDPGFGLRVREAGRAVAELARRWSGASGSPQRWESARAEIVEASRLA